MAELIIVIISVLVILLVAVIILFPLIKLRKNENEILPKVQMQQPEEQNLPSSDSEAQIIINIENYHEAKNELPQIRCEHCGNKNKSDSRKCKDCGATL